MAIYYRVCKPDSQEGLWYTPAGEFTGNIHTAYSFCSNSHLQMPFDQELVGWLSATTSLEELYQWFSKDDILRLQQYGYYIHSYEAEDVKFYTPYQHQVISQTTSKLLAKHTL